MKRYLITALKWFDNINGNTYHSVRIAEITGTKNEELVYIPFAYGYGDSYRQTAYDWLVENKRVKKEDQFNHELNHKRFIFVVNDVTRKRDL